MSHNPFSSPEEYNAFIKQHMPDPAATRAYLDNTSLFALLKSMIDGTSTPEDNKMAAYIIITQMELLRSNGPLMALAEKLHGKNKHDPTDPFGLHMNEPCNHEGPCVDGINREAWAADLKKEKLN